jgi:serine beta-lactamase-like protein LACTB
MTTRRTALIAGIVGLVGAGAVLLGWRLFARRLLTAPALVADSVPQCSKTPEDSRYTQSIQKARPRLLAMMRERRIPGMSVTVAVNERIVWSEGFGRRLQACPDTRYRVGSVSKPITAAVMARLWDEGVLDIDASVRQYVPTFPDKGQAITLRHLASHRAGIRHYRDDMEAFTRVKYNSLRESLALFQNDTLLFAPDTKHEYSSYGYALLGAAMESAAREEFGALIERELRGIGMIHTTVDRNDSTLVRCIRRRASR